MKPHPYLRAYMAGVTVPSVVLLAMIAIYAHFQFYFEAPNQFVIPLPGPPLERAMVFPMAVVPNMWGAWNMLHLATRSRTRLSLGIHGALLPVVLIPAGIALARLLDVFTIQPQFALPMFPVGMTVYYLAWKYLVGFLNKEVGIAA